MYERVEVIDGNYTDHYGVYHPEVVYSGSLVGETEHSFLVILDITGKVTACSKRQVNRYMGH